MSANGLLSKGIVPSDVDLPAQDLPAHVRVDARLKLAVSGESGVTRLVDRREEGAMRFRFPGTKSSEVAPGSREDFVTKPKKVTGCEAMLVNIAGGLAGGDRVLIEARAEAGATLTLSSAAAERVYRSAGAETRIEIALNLTNSTLVWLPQETLLHDGARLNRRLTIDLDAASSLLFGEMLYFGRNACAESYTHGALRESWRIRRDNRLILADETRLEGAFGDTLTRAASLGSATAMATLLFAHADAGEKLDAIRAALAAHQNVESGASDLGGLVFARLVAENGAALRAAFLSCARAMAADTISLPRLMLNG